MGLLLLSFCLLIKFTSGFFSLTDLKQQIQSFSASNQPKVKDDFRERKAATDDTNASLKQAELDLGKIQSWTTSDIFKQAELDLARVKGQAKILVSESCETKGELMDKENDQGADSDFTLTFSGKELQQIGSSRLPKEELSLDSQWLDALDRNEPAKLEINWLPQADDGPQLKENADLQWLVQVENILCTTVTTGNAIEVRSWLGAVEGGLKIMTEEKELSTKTEAQVASQSAVVPEPVVEVASQVPVAPAKVPSTNQKSIPELAVGVATQSAEIISILSKLVFDRQSSKRSPGNSLRQAPSQSVPEPITVQPVVDAVNSFDSDVSASSYMPSFGKGGTVEQEKLLLPDEFPKESTATVLKVLSAQVPDRRKTSIGRLSRGVATGIKKFTTIFSVSSSGHNSSTQSSLKSTTFSGQQNLTRLDAVYGRPVLRRQVFRAIPVTKQEGRQNLARLDPVYVRPVLRRPVFRAIPVTEQGPRLYSKLPSGPSVTDLAIDVASSTMEIAAILTTGILGFMDPKRTANSSVVLQPALFEDLARIEAQRLQLENNQRTLEKKIVQLCAQRVSSPSGFSKEEAYEIKVLCDMLTSTAAETSLALKNGLNGRWTVIFFEKKQKKWNLIKLVSLEQELDCTMGELEQKLTHSFLGLKFRSLRKGQFYFDFTNFDKAISFVYGPQKRQQQNEETLYLSRYMRIAKTSPGGEYVVYVNRLNFAGPSAPI